MDVSGASPVAHRAELIGGSTAYRAVAEVLRLFTIPPEDCNPQQLRDPPCSSRGLYGIDSHCNFHLLFSSAPSQLPASIFKIFWLERLLP